MKKLESNSTLKITDAGKNKPTGRKRRNWLPDVDKEKGVYRPPLEKGSIDPLSKCMDKTLKGVYRPPLEKGSIDPLCSTNKKEQSQHIKETLSFKKLRGNPQKIILLIFENLHQKKLLSSEPITLTEIMKALNISRDSARTALRFLLKNKFMERTGFKNGRNGWSEYSIQEKLYGEILELTKKGSIGPLCSTNKKRGSNNSSSVRTNTINKNLFESSNSLLNWNTIDITPLSEIGLRKEHLLQLKERNTPEIVQNSIKHFAFGLKINGLNNKYEKPISVLMGVLRKGEAWIETNYKSPETIKENEILKKKREEEEKKEIELKKIEEDNYFKSLSEWESKLTKKEKEQILLNSKAKTPEKASILKIPESVRINLFFKEKIWPKTQANQSRK